MSQDPGPTRRISGESSAGWQDPWEGRRRVNDTVILGRDSTGPLAMLVVKGGEQHGRIFRLSAEPRGSVVGRDADADHVLDNSAISGRHLCVRLEKVGGESDAAEKFFAIDLASANGMEINDQKVHKQVLSDGDRIKIGKTVLVFKQV